MSVSLNEIKERFRENVPEPIGKHRFFSVLVPLVEKDGELNLLFELRSSKMKADPGEICFPGGHVEPGEDFRTAAVRETFEEIGIPEDRIEVIGQGNTIFGYANYTMYTYIGVIRYEDYLNVSLCEDEVEAVFLIPLSRFQQSEPNVYTESVTVNISDGFPYEFLGIDEDYYWRTGKWDIPVYGDIDIDIDVHGTRVWGLTARIVKDLVDTLEE